jgi:hypothetical protein
LRDTARRFHTGVPARRHSIIAGIAMVAGAAAFTLGLQGASAALAATVSPPTITSAFTPNLIGVGGQTATALSFTIKNPNPSTSAGTLNSLAFTDTLPAGLSVDFPNGENGSCGSTSVIGASGQTISLSGGSLKGGASCTVSVSVIGNDTGTFQNDTGPVAYLSGTTTGATSVGDAETLTVIPAPTLTVTHVRDGARYTYGQVVRPVYSCAQPADPAGLVDCSAQDDLGNDIASGAPLKTKVAGLHSLTVSATSVDGLITTDTVTYTVLPDNRFTIARIKPTTSGAVSFQLTLPGAGKVKVVEVGAHNATLGQYTGSVGRARKLDVTVKPTGSGGALVAGGTSTHVTLDVTYTPKGGVKRTVTKRGVTVG